MKKSKTKISELDKIEAFINDAGSESLGAFGGMFEGGIQLQHVPDELAPCLLAIVESGQEIKSYLDVGTVAGGTVVVVNHFFKPEHIVTVDDGSHEKSHLRQYVLAGIKHRHISAYGITDGIRALFLETGLMFDLIMLDINRGFDAEIQANIDGFGEFLNHGGFMIVHDSLNDWLGGSRVVAKMKKNKAFEFIAEYVSEKHSSPCGTALFVKAESKTRETVENENK